MLRISIVCTTFLMLLNGCATYRNDNLERMQALPQHYSQFDVKLAWEIKRAGNSTDIDGVVQNIRYYLMDDIEIWVSSLDEKGEEVHRSADFVYSLKENEAARFALKIPHAVSGTKLRFMYRYIGHEGGGEAGGDLTWRQTFETAVP